MYSGVPGRGGPVLWCVGVVSSPAEWTVCITEVGGPWLISTVPGSSGPPPGSTAPPAAAAVSAEPAPSTAAWCGDWGSATQTCTNTDAASRAHRTMTPPSGSQQRYITSNDELIWWTKREATLLFSELLSAKNKDPRLGFECCLCEERLDKCGQNNSTSCNHCPLTTAQM